MSPASAAAEAILDLALSGHDDMSMISPSDSPEKRANVLPVPMSARPKKVLNLPFYHGGVAPMRFWMDYAVFPTGGAMASRVSDFLGKASARLGRVLARGCGEGLSGGIAVGDNSKFLPDGFSESDWDALIFGRPAESARAWGEMSSGFPSGSLSARSQAAWIWGFEMTPAQRALSWRMMDRVMAEALITGGFGSVSWTSPGVSRERVEDRDLRVGSLFWSRPRDLPSGVPGLDVDFRLWHMGMWSQRACWPDLPPFPPCEYPKELAGVLAKRAKDPHVGEVAGVLAELEGDPGLERPLVRVMCFSLVVLLGFWVGSVSLIFSTMAPETIPVSLASMVPGLLILLPRTRAALVPSLGRWSSNTGVLRRCMGMAGVCEDWGARMDGAMEERRKWLDAMGSDPAVRELMGATGGGLGEVRAIAMVESSMAAMKAEPVDADVELSRERSFEEGEDLSFVLADAEGGGQGEGSARSI